VKGASAAGRSIPADVLDAPVTGVNLMPGTLRDQLGGATTLLVFLRHFGCVFCRETVASLRRTSDAEGFPPLLFFFQGTPTEGRAFLRRDWPGVRAVADGALRFYEAFGIDRMGWRDMLRPGLWAAERRARAAGFEQGEASGDIWRLPGVFLVRGDRILWAHEFRHAGDLPDFAAVPGLARVAEREAR
jgi:hypothetical protein